MDDMQSRRLTASALENALYSLDKLINDCLLRLVFTVFDNLKSNPIEQLRALKMKLNETNDAQNKIDIQIEKFDSLADQLQQIGIFAAAFASNHRGKILISFKNK